MNFVPKDIDSIIYCVLKDRSLVVFTFFPEREHYQSFCIRPRLMTNLVTTLWEAMHLIVNLGEIDVAKAL